MGEAAPQHRDRGKLGGLIKRQVIHDLALSGMTQQEIADKYGVTSGGMTQFKQRNAEEIEAVRRAAEDEFAGILIASKQNRLSVLQEIVAEAMTPTPKIDNKGGYVYDPASGEVVHELDTRAAMQALKQAAEEMGQLPTRLQIQGGMEIKTNYTIEGVDPGDLR
jgi:DNA-binding CsgD family transcriptional regulator